MNAAQRITFTFGVNFSNAAAFTTETRNVIVQAGFSGMQDVAPMHLLRQPSPYMQDGNVSWLSTDVRVFQLRPGEKINGASNVVMDNPDTVPAAPFNYIQGFLNELRGYGNSIAPPFENISQNEETSQLELSRTVGGTRVLNFAVAKVRYRANTQDAIDVRLFFRTFNTMVSDLGYTVNSGNVQNYRRTPDGRIALLGINTLFSGASNQVISVPYFAEPRVRSDMFSMTTQNDNFNRHTITHSAGQEAVMYFGCWLDFNQTEPQFPAVFANDGPFPSRIPIVQLVRGIHQCLVAEIRYQPGATDPISIGTTPASVTVLHNGIWRSKNPITRAMLLRTWCSIRC